MNKIIKHPIVVILLLTIIPSIILMFILSSNPLLSISAFFTGPFSSIYSFGNMLNRSTPLIFTSLGAFIALKANTFNLGGEGQVYSGATITAILLATFKGEPNFLILITIIICALLFCGIMSWISGLLEVHYNLNSLISTYLISMTLIHICNFLITGPFLMEGSNILTTDKINTFYRLKNILPPSSLSFGFIIAVITVLIGSIILKKSLWGYEFNISGKNSKFAVSMGINSSKYKIMGLTVSGILHGAGGVLLVLGSYHSAISGFHSNLGWNGLSAALLAGSRPIMVLVSALFYSYLDSGSSYATIISDVTIELSAIIKSVLFFVISSRLISEKFIKKGSAK